MKSKVKMGRKRVWATELPVYDSMELTSAATGIPIGAMKVAKKGGAIFIRHGRVHLKEFLTWWFTRPEPEEGGEDEFIDWTKRDKRAAALLKESKLEEERDRVIDFSKVERLLRRLVSVSFFGELERIANEFPATLKGKSEIEINQEVVNQVEQIKKSLKIEMDIWLEKKGKV